MVCIFGGLGGGFFALTVQCQCFKHKKTWDGGVA